MHAVVAKQRLRAPHRRIAGLTGWGLCTALAASLATARTTDNRSEYQTRHVDPITGDIQFIAPRKIGPEDCSEMGAAVGGMNFEWRQQLPPKVRWRQQSDAPVLCQSLNGAQGQRTGLLPGQGCVFVLARQACTIVTAQALSHAQLAHAVRQCVP